MMALHMFVSKLPMEDKTQQDSILSVMQELTCSTSIPQSVRELAFISGYKILLKISQKSHGDSFKLARAEHSLKFLPGPLKGYSSTKLADTGHIIGRLITFATFLND